MLQSLCFWSSLGRPWPGFLPDEAEERAFLRFSQNLIGVWLHFELNFHWLDDRRRQGNGLHGCLILATNKWLVLWCHFIEPFIQLPLVGWRWFRLQIEKDQQECTSHLGRIQHNPQHMTATKIFGCLSTTYTHPHTHIYAYGCVNAIPIITRWLKIARYCSIINKL